MKKAILFRVFVLVAMIALIWLPQPVLAQHGGGGFHGGGSFYGGGHSFGGYGGGYYGGHSGYARETSQELSRFGLESSDGNTLHRSKY